jgi:anaerobic ribonucleoside-triphosphate reductase activating protein
VTTLAIAGWVPCTQAEGPHRRFALWVQGCTLACPGCCNTELWSKADARTIEVSALVLAVLAARERWSIEGVTVVGGEPLEQLDGVAAFAEGALALALGVIVFTGFTIERARALPGFASLWRSVDTLVDGRFDARARAAETRRFVGSTNQRLVHRTARYADPALWHGPRTAELVVGDDGKHRIVGDPDVARIVLRTVTRTGVHA